MALGERTRTTAEAAAAGLRVFVAGIPWTVSEEVLQRDFGECGVVEDLFLLRDSEGNSRGRCFLTFRDEKGVKAALEYDGTDYAGRTIYVKIANDKPKGFEAARGQLEKKAKEESFPTQKPVGCVSLCLKNLGESGEADVRKFLKGCSIQAVRIVHDRATGASRGIAFVDFTATEEVDKAFKKSGKELNGQAIEMRYEAPRSRPRPEGCMTVAVKKLPPETSEADVRKLFQGLESLSDVRVICKDKTTCIGLAFAEFSEAVDVEAAARRDGMAVRGHTVFICYETKSRKPSKGKEARQESAQTGAPPGKKGKNKEKRGGKAVAADVSVAEAVPEEEDEEATEAARKKKQKQAKAKGRREDCEEAEEAAAEDEESSAKAASRKERRKAEEAQEEVAESSAQDAPRKKRRKAEEAQEAEAEAPIAASSEAARKKGRRRAAAAEEAMEDGGEEGSAAPEAADVPEAKPKKKRRREAE